MTEQFDDDRSRDPGRRQMALARGLPFLIFLSLAMAIVALLAFRNFGALRTTADIYDQARVVCNGQPVSAAAPYNPANGDIHPVVVFILSGNGLIQPDQTLVREEWVPDGIASLELALCLKNIRPAIRALCTNSALSNPIGLEAEATLYEAATGQIVAQGIITSDPAAAADCVDELPDEIVIPEGRFPAERVKMWLEPYVES